MSDALRDLHRRWENPPAALVGKLPRGGVQLDYLGHAAVTRALLEADPGWTWEPMSLNEHGTPYIAHRGNTLTMWIRLTVGGVTRSGVGDCPDNAPSPEKQLISDALRNTAMRYGVALGLWSKEEMAGVEIVGVGEAGFSVDVSQDVQATPTPTPDAGPGEVESDGARSVPTPTPGPVQSQADAITTAMIRGEIRATIEQLDKPQKARLRQWMARKEWKLDLLNATDLADVQAYVTAMIPADD